MRRYELPKGWRWVRLGEVAQIIMGQSPPSSTYNEHGEGLPFYQGKADFRLIHPIPRKWCSQPLKIAIENDVLISVRAPVGPANICPEKSCIGRGLAAIRAKNEVDCRFIFFCLRSKERELAELGKGSTFGAIKRDELRELAVPLPPLPEQRRIVARIEELVSRIEEAKRLRRAAREETEAIMPAALSQIYARMKERGVAFRPLGEVCEVNPSRKGKMNYPDDMMVTFVPMSAVDAELGAIVAPEERPFAKVKKGYTWFVENDVLFAKITPCMQNGKATIAKDLLNGIGFGSTEFHVLRAHEEVLPEWVYFFVRQPSFRELAEACFTGSVGQQRVPEGFMKSQEIPVPSLDEQRRIVAYLDRLQAKVEELRRLEEETEKGIEAMTSAILDKAFQGEL